jgi:exopolyphosphatase/guanosine-5'-triphosphate,3'-diphosphate pyrophosphatase
LLKANGDTFQLQLPDEWLEQKPVFSADIERESNYILELGLKLSYK